MKTIAAALALLSLAACASSGRWAWRQPDGSEDPERLQQDVHACEAYVKTVEDNRWTRSTRGARPYGGWGNFDFDFCMHQRNWALRYVPGGAAAGEPRT
jgi:hypothetical protein